MSIEEILTNYRVGTAFLWSESILALEPDEYPLLPKLGLCLTNYLNLVVTHIATTLIEDSRQPRWDILERQGEIAADLLAGREVSGWTGAPEIPIAESFIVAADRLVQPAPGPAPPTATGSGCSRHLPLPRQRRLDRARPPAPGRRTRSGVGVSQPNRTVQQCHSV